MPHTCLLVAIAGCQRDVRHLTPLHAAAAAAVVVVGRLELMLPVALQTASSPTPRQSLPPPDKPNHELISSLVILFFSPYFYQFVCLCISANFVT